MPAEVLAPTLASLTLEPLEGLRRLASMGFRAVQISAAQAGTRPRELDTSARRGLAVSLKRLDLLLSGIDLWIPTEHFRDPARSDRAVSAALDGIRLAADLGRCPLSLVLPAPAGDDEPDPGADDGSLEDMIESIVAEADRLDVPLADHALPPTERSGTGVGVDPAAWLARDLDPCAAVTGAGDRLISARVSDLLSTGLRGPIGDSVDGRLDVRAYRVSLDVVGYRRPVVADLRQWPNPIAGLERTAAVWAATGPPAE